MPVKTLKLSDGNEIPWIAFGSGTAYYLKGCKDAVALALSLGFTHIDTAAMYENEEDVGEAIASSQIPRESLYVTTKLGAMPLGGAVEESLRTSLKKLQLGYVDLYLVHAPFHHLERPGGLKQVWREMIEVKKKGLARSIGVSNFSIKYLDEIIEPGVEKPVVNQIEYHLLVAARLEPLLAYSRKHGIITAAWSCLRLLMPDAAADEHIAPVIAKLKSVLDEVAKTRSPSVTQNQILFKWLESKNIIAVTTSTKDWRMKEYLETDNLKDLTQEEVQVIEQSVAGTHHRFHKRGTYIDEI